MLRSSFLLLVCGVLLSGMVVIDRVAVVVGQRAVKASDIDRDLRVSAFLNGQPLDLSAAAKRKAAERLIEQEMIRQEMMNGGYSQPGAQEVDAFLTQIRRTRSGGNDAQFRAALAKYGITEEQLRRSLLWQLTVLRFIDQRFRPGVLVTDEDVKSYYDQHRAELQKANPGANSLEALDPKIREILSGERVNQLYGEWVDQTRRSTRVELREGAFSEGVSR